VTRRDDAVAARRSELRARRRRLAAPARADVAPVLALARLACAEQLGADLGRLRSASLARIERAGPRELADLHRELGTGLAAVGSRLDEAFSAHTAPELRRLVAAACPGAAVLPLEGPDRAGADVLRAADEPPAPRRALLAEPRLVGALAGLPVLAVHGIGLPAALVAAGLVLLAGCLARVRVLDRERARAAEHLSRTVAAAGSAGERELARRLIRTEETVVAALERAARDRRQAVDAELAALDAAAVG
jgi:hypothetical protein